MPETIYAVFATTTNSRECLGYATGALEDIKAFYHERRAYGLEIEVVKPNHIPPGYVSKKAKLLARKRELQQQLINLDAEIKLIGG